jgi:alpha-N-acetylglucosaminidase
VWNALVVYGGRRGLYGALPAIAAGPFEAKAQYPNMDGVGFTPEAIDQCQPAFELVLEAAWRAAAVNSTGAWLQQYTARRYGAPGSPSLAAAAATLAQAVYTVSSPDVAVVELSPSLGTTTSHNTNATGVLEALRLFVTAGSSGEADPGLPTFSYDITDLSRQVG